LSFPVSHNLQLPEVPDSDPVGGL